VKFFSAFTFPGWEKTTKIPFAEPCFMTPFHGVTEKKGKADVTARCTEKDLVVVF
jgi:hypothetical protein